MVKKSKTPSKDANKVEARPIGQGKDPLAAGYRLYNDSNTEDATHYRKEDEPKPVPKKVASQAQTVGSRAKAAVPNGTTDEQEAVAEARSEK